MATTSSTISTVNVSISTVNSSYFHSSTTGNTTEAYRLNFNSTMADRSTTVAAVPTTTYGGNSTLSGINSTTAASPDSDSDYTTALVGGGFGGGFVLLTLVIVIRCLCSKEEELEPDSSPTEHTTVFTGDDDKITRKSSRKDSARIKNERSQQYRLNSNDGDNSNENCEKTDADKETSLSDQGGLKSESPVDDDDPVYQNIALTREPSYHHSQNIYDESDIYANTSFGMLKIDGIPDCQWRDSGYSAGEFSEYDPEDEFKYKNNVADKYRVDIKDVQPMNDYEIYANINIPCTNWDPEIYQNGTL